MDRQPFPLLPTCAVGIFLLLVLGPVTNADRSSGWQQHGNRRLSQRSYSLLKHRQDVCQQPYPGVPLNWQPARKVLALTFDDGPEARGLPAVLDILKKHHAPAAFFVNTYSNNSWLGPFNSPQNKAALRRAIAEGHEVGSHAAEHLRLTELTTAQAEQQILWALGNISSITGSSSVPLFRAPYGDGFVGVGSQAPNSAVQQLWDIIRRHHVHIAWSFEGKDYKIGGPSPGCSDRLFEAFGPPLVQQAVTGVVLMHSTPNAMGGCPQALDRLLAYWKSHGYSFVRVSDLVEELYGMAPEAVVLRARACPTRQLAPSPAAG